MVGTFCANCTETGNPHVFQITQKNTEKAFLIASKGENQKSTSEYFDEYGQVGSLGRLQSVRVEEEAQLVSKPGGVEHCTLQLHPPLPTRLRIHQTLSEVAHLPNNTIPTSRGNRLCLWINASTGRHSILSRLGGGTSQRIFRAIPKHDRDISLTKPSARPKFRKAGQNDV